MTVGGATVVVVGACDTPGRGPPTCYARHCGYCLPSSYRVGVASLRPREVRDVLRLDRIRDKTGCRRRADLTRLALTTGLV